MEKTKNTTAFLTGGEVLVYWLGINWTTGILIRRAGYHCPLHSPALWLGVELLR
jgi:hypothetical protein